MVYFAIKGSFKPFTGQVVDFREELNGVCMPHQVIRNGHGNVLVACVSKSGHWDLQKSEVGSKVTVSPDNRGYMIIDPSPGNIHGQVAAARTFGLGRDAFLSALTVKVGEEEFKTIAFRPYPSQKRKMGLDLAGKDISLENNELFVIESKRRKPWLK